MQHFGTLRFVSANSAGVFRANKRHCRLRLPSGDTNTNYLLSACSFGRRCYLIDSKMPNIVLKRFMIFNPNDGQQEGSEKDKLLYHWTKEALNNKVQLVEQIDDICLCDASVTASIRLNSEPTTGHQFLTSSGDSNTNGRFRLSQNCRSLVLTFDTTLVLMVEVEPEQSIWVAVHVAPSHSVDTVDSHSNHSLASNQQQIDPNCIPMAAIERVVNNIYTRFSLINGTFQMIADEALEGQRQDILDSEKRQTIIRDKIRSICEEYFNVVLPEIHLNSIIANVAALYNYVVYLNLNPLTLMRVNSFINHLVCIDAVQIRHTIAIFNNQLLWSSLNMYDTRLVYNYLVFVLIRNALQEELSKETDKVRRIKEDMPIFLKDISDESNNIEETIPARDCATEGRNSFASKTDKRLTKFHMTVFRSSNNMTLGLMFKNANQVNLIQKCEQILTSDSRFGVVPLASLAQSVGQNFLKANSFNLNSPSSQSSLSLQTGVSSSSSRRQQTSGSSSSLMGSIPVDEKYICLDRMNVSVTCPFMYAQSKEKHLLIGTFDGGNQEIFTGNKRIRLIRYLLDLEPEFQSIARRTSSQVEEFFGKTTSDTWLTVTNSQYRSIYSIYKMRNAGLSEAQQSAMSLKLALANGRP